VVEIGFVEIFVKCFTLFHQTIDIFKCSETFLKVTKIQYQSSLVPFQKTPSIL
jgi:hypothetical protein